MSKNKLKIGVAILAGLSASASAGEISTDDSSIEIEQQEINNDTPTDNPATLQPEDEKSLYNLLRELGILQDIEIEASTDTFGAGGKCRGM